MAHFLRPCPCARGAARSCCRYCCSPFRSRPFSRWSRPRGSSSQAKARLASGLCCFSRTIWCLLLLVWLCLTEFCTRNEARLPHPVDCHGNSAGVRPVPSFGGCAHREHYGRRAADFLLPCAVSLDRVSSLPDESCGFRDLPDLAQSEG